MFFTFYTFTMECVGLLAIFAMLLFAILFLMELIGLMGGVFSTFTFQILARQDLDGLIGIFTMNESGVRA